MKNTKKGFTIVELVIVIAVIAILAGVLIPTFSGIVEKANRSSAVQECTNLYKNYYTLCKADSASAKEGLILKKDGYAFTYIDRTLVEVNHVGKLNGITSSVILYLVGVNKYDTVDFFNSIYKMRVDITYDVYSYTTSSGIYAFYVNDSFKSESLSSKSINVYDCPICFFSEKETNLLDFDVLALKNAFFLDVDDNVCDVLLTNESLGKYITIKVKDGLENKITECEIGNVPNQDFVTLKEITVTNNKELSVNVSDFKEVLNSGKEEIILAVTTED